MMHTESELLDTKTKENNNREALENDEEFDQHHSNQQQKYGITEAFHCCQKGRDFENRHTNHVFSPSELKTMSNYESMNYLPQNSKVYRKWLAAQNPGITENHWDKWILMGLIGFGTGLTGYLLKSLTEIITAAKFKFIQGALDQGSVGLVFLWIAGISIIMVLISSSLVVFVAPEAAGSGVPAVIGYLNGVYVHHLYDVRVFVVKFISTFLAVSSGLPVGPEGPMVYMGATLGKQLSQGNSKACSWYTKCVKRFRNMQSRRDFISAGAGAGIASAFGAPVGGMLFAMEEVASFWNMTLAWQILFCCMTASFTTEVLISYFGGFELNERNQMFGAINEESGIIFAVKTKLSLNIMIFIPTIIIGLLGGAMGAGFTFCSLKMNRFRKNYIEPRKWLRVLEPVIIVLIMSAIAVYLPAGFKCQPHNCETLLKKSAECLASKRTALHAEVNLHRYTCVSPQQHQESSGSSSSSGVVEGRMLRFLEGSEGGAEGVAVTGLSNVTEFYNPAASLLFVTGESAVEHLFSRKTTFEFDYAALFSMFLLWFPMACWCAGSAVASGLVVPILIIGAAFGRICGLVIVDMTGTLYQDPNYDWIDPGAFALIGAAAFFGGVSRLTISLTVIMMEITNDIRFLLPIMTSILVSKLAADQLTHSLYHALLELKCIPFIGGAPPPSESSLDLHPVSTIMMRRPCCLPLKHGTAKEIVACLKECCSNAFPVVDDQNVFRGMILRKHVLVVLKTSSEITLTYDMLEGTQNDSDYVHEVSKKAELKILRAVGTSRVIDFTDVVSSGSVTVQESFPIQRAFIIFRSLGLRHMTIVNKYNVPVGIITRKELLGMHIEHGVHSHSHVHVDNHDIKEHDSINPLESHLD